MFKIFLYRDAGAAGAAAGAGGAGGNGDASVTVNHAPPGAQPPTYTPPNISVMDAAPVEYRTKEYLKGIKDIPTLFKEFDNLQTKLGQRPSVGVPAADAKPEDVKNFYAQLTPKDVKEYVFPETDFSKSNPRDQGFVDGLRGVFQKAGISAHQAAQFLPFAEEFLHSYITNRRAADDTAFETELKTFFKGPVEESMKAAKAVMGENIPKELLPRLDKLPNDALMFMSIFAQSVHDKYIKEDAPLGTPAGGGGKTAEEFRREAQELSNSEAWKNSFHPDHDKTVAKVQELYAAAVGLSSGKKS